MARAAICSRGSRAIPALLALALGQASVQASVSTPGNPLDPPRQGPAVARLEGAQLHRLPVSWFFREGQREVAGPHRLVVRTDCPSSAPEQRDSGLYVVQRVYKPFFGWQVVSARFNDDCTGGACRCSTCSLVDMGAVNGTARYDIHAFSVQRTKASCSVHISTTTESTPAFSTLRATTGLGGTLVDVGPVARGSDERLAVESLAGGSGFADTHMLLFDTGGPGQPSATAVQGSAYVPVFAVDGADGDPAVGPNITPASISAIASVCDDAYGCASAAAAPRHFLLIGLEQPPPPPQPPFDFGSVRQVETTVNLVRSPSDSEASSAMAAVPESSAFWTCGTPVDLQAGRYSARLDARHSEPYADDDLVEADACRKTGYECGSDVYYDRGAGNTRAFDLGVQGLAEGSNTWAWLGPARTVPAGAFGGDGVLQTFLHDFELTASMSVRACARNRHPRVTLGATWRAVRNPLWSELKVATFNAHHGKQAWWDSDGIENDAEGRNMADLLAARGRYSWSAQSVVERPDQAPFEWNADVVALQELSWVGTFNSFLDEAEDNSALDWHYVYGDGKTDADRIYRSYNALFAHEALVPGTSILPPDVEACTTTSSNADENADGYASCTTADDDDEGWGDYTTGSVPARLAVRRFGAGAGDVPVMAYSVMLNPGNDTYWQRRQNLEALIGAITQHLQQRPSMFNRAGVAQLDHPDNRIVLAGDFNFMPHLIGENRWMVERLRQVFGHAVDVAAAAPESFANFYDMHAFRGGAIGTSSPFDPLTYTSWGEWSDLPNDDETKWWWGQPGMSFPHHFPYWAATFRGGNEDHGSEASRDRNDAIFLIGRGWAKDDPVRDYVVMHTTTQGDSPFAIHRNGQVAAVDIQPGESDVDVPNGGVGYRPQRDLTNDFGDGCTVAGCAAVESDHIPVGVRLRITQ